MPSWLLILGSLFCFVSTSLLSWLIVRRGVHYWDPSYFIDRMQAAVYHHLRPYTDLEFPYGPLLFYLPVVACRLLRPMGWSDIAAYYACYVCLATVGVGVLFYVLDELPLSLPWKRIGFLVLVTQAPSLDMGINYTLFRFLIPFGLFLWAVKRISVPGLMLVSSVAVFLALSVSPEMGIAITAGLLAYFVLKFWKGERLFLIAVVGPVTGFAVFLLLFGRGPLATLGQFGHGVFNFVVQPLFYILVLLVALIWFAPQAVASNLARQGGDLRIPALYIIALSLLPAALGRADPMHVMSDGMGFYLLSMLVIHYQRKWVRTVWVGSLLVACSVTQVVTAMDFKVMLHALLPRTAELYARQGQAPDWFDSPSQSIDLLRLQARVGNAKIFVPVPVAATVEKQLRASGLTSPDYYFYMVGVWDEQAELRKVRDMDAFKFALLRNRPIQYWETPDWQAQALGGGFKSKITQPVYKAGNLMTADLQQNWAPRQTFGEYVLYERKLAP